MTALASATDKSNESFRDKILRKCGESVEMKEKFFSKYAEQIEALSREMAQRFQRGGKLLTMGNGGSLCDAMHFTFGLCFRINVARLDVRHDMPDDSRGT